MNLFLKLILGAIVMFAALQTNAKISVEEFYNIKFNVIYYKTCIKKFGQ